MKGEKDVLLDLLESGELNALGAVLSEENRRLSDDPNFLPPSMSQQEILRDAYRELEERAKLRVQDKRAKRGVILKRAAIIAIVFLTLTATAMSVEAIRIPILNFFTDSQERATRMSPYSNDDPKPSQYDPKNVESYELRWVPLGFKTESEESGSDYYQQNYANTDSVELRFRVYYYHDYWFDTEDADLVEPLLISGMEGYYVEKGGRSLLTWVDEINLIVFQLLGKLPKETLLQIAEKSGVKN